MDFTRHALGRMSRDVLSEGEIAEAIEHPTHPPRPAPGGRTLARRVHARGVVSVLYEQHPAGPLVISCWRSIR